MHLHPIEPVVACLPRRVVGRRLRLLAPRISPKTAASLVAVALLTSSCEKPAPATLPPPIVQVAEVTLTNVPMSTELIGQLDSPHNVEVRARVEAFVERVLFIEGLPVAEGDLLFELDRKPFEQRLAAARGALAEAEAALNKYRKDVSRLEPLARDRAIPQQDLDNAMASVEIGKANVLSAEARVQSAMIDLDYCEVRAPISGLIGAKEVSIGELVGKGSPTLLATISKLDPIWFYGNISEVQFLRAEAATRPTGKQMEELPIDLILADGTTHPGQGKFVFLDRAVNSGTGTLRLRAEFSNPEGVLRPGMFARIRVHLGARPDSILVPERAVVELQGRNFMWLIDADNRATQRPVRTGETMGGQVLVVEGLQAGERFVLEGLQKVREGLEVQPLTAAQMAQKAAPSPVAAQHEKE
jgi:RND family efflux transporter MFP subunit